MLQTKTKIIYSFKLKNILEMKGFKPLLETDNPRYEGLKCWVFEATPAFMTAFIEVAGREDYHG